MSKIVFLTVLVLGAGTAGAQTNSTMAAPATASGALERIVTGVPFSAESVTEFVQTAADGSHVKRVTTSAVARDSQGRTRYSQNLALLLPAGPRILTFIRDPVAGVRYLMDSRETIARREPIPPAAPVRGAAGAVQPWSAQDAAIKVARQSVKSMLAVPLPAQSPALPSDATPLGERNIEGVIAFGARVSAVVPAGQMGNEKPLTFSAEAWYSPELSIIVMSKVSDPVAGDTNVQITKLRRGEPGPGLFAVPAAFRIVDAAGLEGRRGH